MESEESTPTEQPMEVSESVPPPSPAQQAASQLEVAQEVEPPAGATPPPPPPPPQDEPVDLNPPVQSPTAAEEHDDDNVSLLADEDDADLDLTVEEETEGRSPPNSQDELTLMDSGNPQWVSPGVSSEMAALAVAEGQSSGSAS